ncbi:hypothetical protein GQ457_05G006610 [Hibiscus cannabinus]
MTDYEAFYQSNGEDLENSNGGVPSPQTRRGNQGGLDDHRDSKSQHGSCEHERGSSRSRKKEKIRDRGREKDSDRHRGREREKVRERSKDRDQEKDLDRHHRDRRRDRSRERSERRGRDRDDDDDYHRSRSYDRRRDYDRDRESRKRRGSHRSEHRSKSKRISGFDTALPSSAMLADAVTATSVQIPGNNPALPGVFPNMFPLAAAVWWSPSNANDSSVLELTLNIILQSVATYFNQVMAEIGGNTAGPGDAVVNVYIKYKPWTEVCFCRDEIRLRRPSDYNPSIAATLGPSQPSPNLNLAAVRLSPRSARGLEGPDRIFVGGLPFCCTEEQIRELLESFGPTPSRDIACTALNGIKMGDRTLTVRRGNQGTTQPKPEQVSNLLQHAQLQIALEKLMLQPVPQGVPTKVVCLTQAISEDNLRDDEEYGDIVEDMREEGGKYGALVNVVIPRPNPNGEGEALPGVGRSMFNVFLEYSDVEGCRKAQAAMNGRKFGDNQVIAAFYPENKFAQGDYDAMH